MKKNYSRKLNLDSKIKKNSYFLFGPRGTGKSWLIEKNLKKKKTLIIDLLKHQDYIRLAENPSILEEMINLIPNLSTVVIDEIQKIPALTNEVHRLIESKKNIKFLLTGSSARKLKRGNANLLAGRARVLHLWPLTYHELISVEKNIKLINILYWGGLPEVWQLMNESIAEKKEYLHSYIDVYLKEEIMIEQLARNLIFFSRFLKIAALSSGELINYAQMASDAQLPVSSVKNYFEVLQDTMIGTLLEPWTESKKRKAILTAKFYFFDIGVCNALMEVDSIHEKSELYGKCFEHFIFYELRAYLAYNSNYSKLYYWRSVNQHEVDFLVGNTLAIEVKSKDKTSFRDAKNLMALKEEKIHKNFIVVSNDTIDRVDENGIQYLHWKSFLKNLWTNKYFN